jgi:shikimate dehydrogenase
MHRAAFRELGLEATYELLRVPADRPDSVESVMRGVASDGGGNVTVPHKHRAAGVLEVATELVRRTRACNCFWLDECGRLSGDNTDAGGIQTVLETRDEFNPIGSRVLVLGAGGAGAAAVVAALAAGASRVSVRNRTGQRASDLVSALADPRVSREHAEPDPGDWDLVIQATSLGLEEADPLPLSLSGSKPGNALDLVYRPGGTAWVHHARACGWSAEDGLGVLLEQGVLSLGRWLDSPIPPSVRSAMEDALVTGAAP